jgi:hypothetical protein
MDWNLGWNYCFLGIVKVGFACAFFVWVFSRVIRAIIALFQSRTGQIRIEK